MIIRNYISVSSAGLWRNGRPMLLPAGQGAMTPETVYGLLQCAYPKFFKMDTLCKWAFLGTEYLLQGDTAFSIPNKNKIALVLSTAHGCIDVDKRFHAGMDMPSPALFVYTLPNIMLGEICIRHGFKGEQLCFVNDRFDAEELYLTTRDLMENRGMAGCICGWADAANGAYDVFLMSVLQAGKGTVFSAGVMQELYTAHNGQTAS